MQFKNVLLILMFMRQLFAVNTVKVYQNGHENYDGCSDTYLFSIGATPSTQDQNFGKSELLKSAN